MGPVICPCKGVKPLSAMSHGRLVKDEILGGNDLLSQPLEGEGNRALSRANYRDLPLHIRGVIAVY